MLREEEKQGTAAPLPSDPISGTKGWVAQQAWDLPPGYFPKVPVTIC